MKKLFFIFIIILCYHSSWSQEYNVTNIQDSLLNNANAVVRKESMSFSIKSPGKAIEKYNCVITILNESASDYNRVSVHYDKLSSISSLKAALYDKNGVKIKDYKNSDFKDISLISSSSIYDDNRIKTQTLYHASYPYTIEYSVTKEYKGLLGYPGWFPQNSFNLSVQHSDYSIDFPKDLNIKIKENLIKKNKEEINNQTKIISYNIDNLTAIQTEPMSVGVSLITPHVSFAPTSFEYDGFPGDLSNWNSYGKWLFELSNGLTELPLNEKEKVSSLIGRLNTDKEKVKAIYKYLQSKSRYVSIQLGIGGFRPFPAEKVAMNGYGDCKALSNYMLALLKHANIKSYLVVVGANPKSSLNENFSSANQANHMILCVPLQKDTVWLECTSQKSPFNYLGSFTEGRNVLLITEKGGQIAKTPTLSAKDNGMFRKANIQINPDGSAAISMNTLYTGEQFEDFEVQLYNEPKNQKDFIYHNIDIPSPKLISYSYEQSDKDKASLNEVLKLEVDKATTTLGNRTFLVLNMLNKRTYIPEVSENRKTGIKLNRNYQDYEEIIYELPVSHNIEFLPSPTEIKSDFGIYKSSIKSEGNKLIYIREQTMFKKNFPASRIKDLADFYRQIYNADKQKVVLVSN